MNISTNLTFADELKAWRKARRLSQLDLALHAGVSQRHVSFLESRRAAPSREMVALLSAALSLPARARDAFLLAAGYAPASRAKGIDDPMLAPAREALDFVLERAEPFPALALSRDWNILAANSAMQRVSGWLVTGDPKATFPLLEVDFLDLLTDPNGVRRFMTQGEAITVALLDTMIAEAVASRDTERLKILRGHRGRFDVSAPALEPLPVLEFTRDGWSLRFVTILTHFAAPCDASLEGVKTELFYPADGATRTLLEAWAKT